MENDDDSFTEVIAIDSMFFATGRMTDSRRVKFLTVASIVRLSFFSSGVMLS